MLGGGPDAFALRVVRTWSVEGVKSIPAQHFRSQYGTRHKVPKSRVLAIASMHLETGLVSDMGVLPPGGSDSVLRLGE
eukprot:15480244-Alexandrium_andersonii.AAC.1